MGGCPLIRVCSLIRSNTVCTNGNFICLVNARAIHMACCHVANRLALTVSENERNIANYITDFHKLYKHLYRGHGTKRMK